jgi:hypothetical protein
MYCLPALFVPFVQLVAAAKKKRKKAKNAVIVEGT